MDDRPSIHVTTINGNQFVSGLYWQPLTRPRAYMKEAREIGKQRGMDIVAIRKSDTLIQGGFVSKTEGAHKGMYSMAAALAGQLGDTWLGAFKLPDGQYALVGILRGGVIPGADMIGDLETISAALRSVYAYKHGINDNDIYAPEEMDFGGKAIDIEKILTPVSVRKEYLLKPLSFTVSKKQVVVIGAVALALVAGVGGYMRYQAIEAQRKHDAEVMAAKIKVAEMEALNAKLREEQAAKMIVHPWTLLPSIQDFVERCGASSYQLPLSTAGWKLVASQCDGQHFTSTFKRTDSSTVADFVQYAASAGYKNEPVFQDGGDTATITLDIPTPVAGDDALLPAQEMVNYLISHFQRIGIKPAITETKIEKPVLPAQLPGQETLTQIVPPEPDWKQYGFSFETHLTPEVTLAGLRATGIRLTDITNTVSNYQLTWSIKGQIYAK
jgi:hypothetical protein